MKCDFALQHVQHTMSRHKVIKGDKHLYLLLPFHEGHNVSLNPT